MQSKIPTLFAAFWMVFAIQTQLIAQPVFSSSDYRFQHYDMSDGLASDHAREIVQDSLGFIWILHHNGLSRYDGHTFKVYTYDPNDRMSMGPPVDGFLELDHSGNLWIISNQGYQPDFQYILTKYDREKDGFVKYYPDMQGAMGRSVCFDKNNMTVWIGTWGRGLYSFDFSTGETKAYLNMFRDSVVNLERHSPMEQRNAIWGISDRDSVLLLATWRGFWQFDKATKVFSYAKCHPADSLFFHNAPVVSIIESKYNDDLFFEINDVGLFRVRHDLSEKATNLLKELNWGYRRFKQDNYGILWLTDINEGLYRFDPKDGSLVTIKSNVEDPYSLRSNALTGFTIDRDQNLWITTMDRGISKLPKQRVRFYNYKFSAKITANTVHSANEKNYLLVSQSMSGRAGDNQLHFAALDTSNLEHLEFNKVNMKYTLKGKVSQLAMGKRHLWIGTGGSPDSEGVVSLPVNPSSGLQQ